MNVRQATPADSFLLSSLCMDVQRLHAEHHPRIFKTPQNADFAAEFFDEMLADPAAIIYIAEENEQALGYFLCKMIEREEGPFTYPNRFLHIDQISVRPDAQGRGAGTALIDEVERLAQELGASRIQLDSWNFNTKAHTFFEAPGFEKFNYRFWRNL